MNINDSMFHKGGVERAGANEWKCYVFIEDTNDKGETIKIKWHPCHRYQETKREAIAQMYASISAHNQQVTLNRNIARENVRRECQ